MCICVIAAADAFEDYTWVDVKTKKRKPSIKVPGHAKQLTVSAGVKNILNFLMFQWVWLKQLLKHIGLGVAWSPPNFHQLSFSFQFVSSANIYFGFLFSWIPYILVTHIITLRYNIILCRTITQMYWCNNNGQTVFKEKLYVGDGNIIQKKPLYFEDQVLHLYTQNIQ